MPRFSDSLLLKNIVIGLTFTTLDFPPILATAGYTDLVLEEPLETTQHRFNFDCLISAPDRNRSLILEIKGGDQAPAETQQHFLAQLDRYSTLQPLEIAGIARITPPHPASQHQHELALLTVATTSRALEKALSQSMFKPPVMVALLQAQELDDLPLFLGLSVATGKLKDPDIEDACKRSWDPSPIPLYLLFDSSSPNGEIVAAVVPSLLEMMLHAHGGARFSTIELLEKTLVSWDLLSREEQRSYDTRVRKALLPYLMESGFSKFLTWDARAGVWVFDAIFAATKKDWQAHLTALAKKVISNANTPSLHDLNE